jgi:hypothetical protein
MLESVTVPLLGVTELFLAVKNIAASKSRRANFKNLSVGIKNGGDAVER